MVLLVAYQAVPYPEERVLVGLQEEVLSLAFQTVHLAEASPGVPSLAAVLDLPFLVALHQVVLAVVLGILAELLAEDLAAVHLRRRTINE